MARLSRSLSDTAENFTFSDNELKNIFFKGLSDFRENDGSLFSDVELIANGGSKRKSHRLVLSCVSPYFRSVFSPMHNGESKTKVELPDISSSALDLILEYAYTSKVILTGETVQDLIVAANYLQLSSLEKACAQFISRNIDESDFHDVITFADNSGLLDLQKACIDYIGPNMRCVLKSSSWLKLTVRQIESILKDDSIRISNSSEHIPPPSIQEKILFEAVLRYVKESELIDPTSVKDTLSKLLSNVRLHLLWKYELDSIRGMLDDCQNKEIVAVCEEMLSPFMDKPPGKIDEFKEKQMPLPRNFPVMKPHKTEPLAFGFVSKYEATFSDRLDGVPRYLKGMKIWNGRFDGEPTFGAMEVTYSDGEKIFHGKRSNHEVYEFMLEPDEFIVKVISSSSWMIRSLEFVTSKGRSYGPYGADGEFGIEEFTPPSGYGYLSFVTGAEAFNHGDLRIVSLSFSWIMYDFNVEYKDSDDLTPVVELGSQPDFKDTPEYHGFHIDPPHY